MERGSVDIKLETHNELMICVLGRTKSIVFFCVFHSETDDIIYERVIGYLTSKHTKK